MELALTLDSRGEAGDTGVREEKLASDSAGIWTSIGLGESGDRSWVERGAGTVNVLSSGVPTSSRGETGLSAFVASTSMETRERLGSSVIRREPGNSCLERVRASGCECFAFSQCTKENLFVGHACELNLMGKKGTKKETV